MTEITHRLDPALHRDLADLADAQGRGPDEVVGEALEAYVRAQGALVRGQAERLASAHAELLRRLGE
ncbi:hypothetical protein [Streptomyces torulosus]|uniref:hypothetical protein n=1 Tax=Streptomyces torulosus TaxID=68276 RepID=UPI0006EB93F9|nr:hypothetical protein [Streptomyces torulosus]